MNKTFKKVFSVCCAVVTTLTATLFYSTNLRAGGQPHHIVFAGPSQSGKTKLVSRLCGNSYTSDYKATEGATFGSTLRQYFYDLSGQPKYSNTIAYCFQNTDLCVLSISNKNQKTDDFLNVIAKNNVPKVVLCITKTDEGTPDSAAVSKLLVDIKQKLPQGVKVFNEVLYTSAKNNTFRFCKPDAYNISDENQIYDTEKNEKVLAAKLYELCGGKAEDFEAEAYEEETSYDENKTTTSKGKKYALGLGIPAALLPLILGIGYYEYDRHFSEQKNTKTKTNPATASAK